VSSLRGQQYFKYSDVPLCRTGIGNDLTADDTAVHRPRPAQVSIGCLRVRLYQDGEHVGVVGGHVRVALHRATMVSFEASRDEDGKRRGHTDAVAWLSAGVANGFTDFSSASCWRRPSPILWRLELLVAEGDAGRILIELLRAVLQMPPCLAGLRQSRGRS
jgi:hypothetical protein